MVAVTTALDPPLADVDQLLRRGDIPFTVGPVGWYSRAAQVIGDDDFEDEPEKRAPAAMVETIRRTLGIEAGGDHVVVYLALRRGEEAVVQLPRRDQIAAAAMLAGAYLGQRGDVHLMTPDPETTREYEEALRKVFDLLKFPVERVGTGTRATRGVSLGTQQEFAAAGPGLTVDPGSLALIVDPPPDFASQDFLRRYARRAVA
jgi:hypothetical protein